MATPVYTFRPTLPRDLTKCLPLLPPEMGLDAPLLDRLPGLWAELLADEAMEARSIVTGAGAEETVEAFGASVFLRPGCYEEIRAQPRPRLAQRLYRSLEAGERPFLTGREIARANASTGVDLCVLHFCQRPDLFSPAGQELLALGHAAFRDAHQGYNVRTLLHESFGPKHRLFLLASGMALLHDFRATANGSSTEPDPAVDACLVGMTREQSLAEPAGSAISFLFRSNEPRFYFSPSERRVLRFALAGETDAETAEHLGISRDAVKKVWRHVFARVAETGNPPLGWDRQHRRALLTYLRQHPEDLRAYQRPRRSAPRSALHRLH